MNVKGHQICIAHLLRNLNYLNDLDKNQNWSSLLQELLRKA
ncbi:MAG: transposase, partial [Muribaculaceae bacterium]|nr:transposase [Muribaculaceae bacterium]